MKFFFTVIIKIYQFINIFIVSPLLKTAFGFTSECRYEESCSRYSERMLSEHATISALSLIFKRISSCHGGVPLLSSLSSKTKHKISKK